jgi:proteasome lid subunit RPN8/RPN11
MIQLQLHPDLVEKLSRELRLAGDREIGGVLVGEHLGEASFRIVDLSVQRAGGTPACFIRRPEQHARFLNAFFARTGEAFERFNYLGEWHSHPTFKTEPSRVDLQQMQEIVSAGPKAPLFAVLMVVRLGDAGKLQLSALAFRPHQPPAASRLTVVPRPTGDPPPEPVGWWARLFAPSAQPKRRVRWI